MESQRTIENAPKLAVSRKITWNANKLNVNLFYQYAYENEPKNMQKTANES